VIKSGTKEEAERKIHNESLASIIFHDAGAGLGRPVLIPSKHQIKGLPSLKRAFLLFFAV
jgi:hypothetical protein